MIEFIKYDKVKQKYYLTESTRITNAVWEEMENDQATKALTKNRFTIEEENEREIIYFYQYSLN